MYLNRERALAVMEREGLDALVACTPNNVFYLSDFETDFLYDVPWVACAILPRSPDVAPTLIVTEMEACVLADRPSWMPDVRLYFFELYDGVLPVHTFADDRPLAADEVRAQQLIATAARHHRRGAAATVIEALRDTGLYGRRLGFDDTRFAAALGLPAESIVEASHLFTEIRMVKTTAEIDVLRTGATHNETAFLDAISVVRDGATWQDVVTAYEVSLARQGDRQFGTYNGAGRRSAGATRVDRRYPIERGDMLAFDCMMKHGRYMADMQRSAVFGEPSAKHEKYWRALKAGVDECYSSMRAGVSTAVLRERALHTVRSHGIPNFQVAFLHGVGLDHIEIPFATAGRLGKFDLEAGMTINMDMEVHELGFGGVFFEETMLVTPTGAERLYSLERELIRI
jgi:Xaa-Pro dipeptidase